MLLVRQQPQMQPQQILVQHVPVMQPMAAVSSRAPIASLPAAYSSPVKYSSPQPVVVSSREEEKPASPIEIKTEPVPPGWTKEFDDAVNIYYYRNMSTGDIHWRPDFSSYAENLRKRAEAWAQKEGFGKEQMTELGHLIGMSLSRFIPKSKLSNWTVIDKGSFGKIYKCTYHGKDVAVKEIGSSDKDSAIKTRMRDLFLELRILVKIKKHKNIVEFLGTALDFPESLTSHPTVNMVFGMCPGGSLHNFIFGSDDPSKQSQNSAKLSVLNKVKIGSDVAAGLAYLHLESIIHRDLSTRNVLIMDDLSAKIADFGCARILPESGSLQTSTVLGSPAYMSPEQLRGDELTRAIDTWALGLMLWEMMTEKKPWEGVYGDFKSLSTAVLRGERVPMPSDTSQYPKVYIDMIHRTSAALPQDRPTAEQIHQELQTYLDQIFAPTLPSPSLQPPSPKAKQEPAAVPTPPQGNAKKSDTRSIWARILCLPPVKEMD